jgi:thiamine pyrophosphate-dependent acetolactate synthase large subunit-like protein
MKRKDCVELIMGQIQEKDIVISSTGMISREVFHTKDRPRNFYVMGSMGCSVAIGLGVALNVKDKVIVIAGDGDVLMDLGSLVLANKLQLPNFYVYILDNNQYAATGGQPTCSDAINFALLYNRCTVMKADPGKGDTPRITLTHPEIKKRFMGAIK